MAECNSWVLKMIDNPEAFSYAVIFSNLPLPPFSI